MLDFNDLTGRIYETGLDRGVLYIQNKTTGDYDAAYVWDGLTAVNETPGGAEPKDLYASNTKYMTLLSAETFGFTIEAYMFPKEFGACDGVVEPVPGMGVSQQERAVFGLCYRTKIGSQAGGSDAGYKLNLVYGCLASPSDLNHQTINDSPDAVNFSWDVTSTPVPMTGYKAVSKIVLDSTVLTAAQMTAIEEELWGNVGDTITPNLPLPDEVLSIIQAA